MKGDRATKGDSPDLNDTLREKGPEAVCERLKRATKPKPNGDAVNQFESLKASSIVMHVINWMWPNRFALGKLGLIGGLPDRGKGLITADIAATVTTGGTWPCGEGRAIQGNVLLLTAEDDLADTVVPRLAAAKADLDRVHILKMVRRNGGDRAMFNLTTDLDLLRQKIIEIGDVVLVIIDPISAYLGVGKVDSYRTTDVRGVLLPLTQLAADTNISIIGIMHFNKKTDVHNAMLRISDSLAFVAASRHCYVAVDDTENERRLLVKAKNNLAPDTKALSYTVAAIDVGEDPENGKTIWAPYVHWGPEHVNVSGEEALEAETAGRKPKEGPRTEAKRFLEEMLACGPVPVKDIEEAAKANLISEKTLDRAKRELGVEAKKSAFAGGWTWQLPEQKHHNYQ